MYDAMYSANQIRSASEDSAKEMVRENIAKDDTWLIRGLLAIYRRQTADEQDTEDTRHENGVGFNGRDAKILSSFAKQVLAWEGEASKRYPTPLSRVQFEITRERMSKYAGQLARIAQGG